MLVSPSCCFSRVGGRDWEEGGEEEEDEACSGQLQ
jgi:hypothetical protein